MKKNQIGFILGLVCLLVINTNVFAIRGSGKLATEKRTVPAFHSIELSGTGNVYLQQGSEQSLTVTTDANLMSELNTNVFNGKLKIGFRNGVSRITRLDIHITLKELKGLNISGSGNIEGKGVFNASDLNINISGSGEIILETEAKTISSNISGSGEINLKGRVEAENIRISGSGDYNAFNLLSDKASVVIQGSGNCRINVAQELDAEVYGSGNVEYQGRPVVNIKSSGSGSIRAVK